MKQLFLPVGLILAIVAAIVFPGGGVFINDNHGLKILVFVIFTVSGYQTRSDGPPLDTKLARLFLVAITISLIVAPLLGLATGKILGLPFHLTMGLIIISTVPPTLSSGIVITDLSEGNGILALFLTISLNLLGIFSIPFMLDFCLKAAGPVDIAENTLLIKMLFLVLLPFVIGKLIRFLRRVIRVHPSWMFLNSSCVILIVYSSLAVSKTAFSCLLPRDYLLIIVATAMVHFLLLLLNTMAANLLKLNSADAKALIFVCSQKTLPIAIAILTNVKFDTANAIVVCIIFHFLQLFVDSSLASVMKRRSFLFARQK